MIHFDHSNKNFIVNIEPKLQFINEMWIGKVKIPIKTELDFTGVHPSQHERIIDIALKLFNKSYEM